MEVIKNHVSRKLGTNVFLTPLSKEGAPFLSFGLYCRSERDDLDFKMPNLWPDGTQIYKWRTNRHNRRFGSGNRHSESNSLQTHQRSSAGMQDGAQRRPGHHVSSAPLSQDRQRMLQQWSR